MVLNLSERMSVVQPSAIIKVAGKARELKAAGLDVISLSIGVPGFTPPAHVYAAAHGAVDSDSGDYLPGRGSNALVGAFRKSLEARGFKYGDTEVCAQVGGKGALFNLLLALVNPGGRGGDSGPLLGELPRNGEDCGWGSCNPAG